MRTLTHPTLDAGAVLGLSAWLGPVALSHPGSQASDPTHDLVCAGNAAATRASVFSGEGA